EPRRVRDLVERVDASRALLALHLEGLDDRALERAFIEVEVDQRRRAVRLEPHIAAIVDTPHDRLVREPCRRQIPPGAARREDRQQTAHRDGRCNRGASDRERAHSLGTADAARQIMRILKRLLIIGALAGVGACTVSTTPGYYSYGYGRYCAYGWYWNGYRCVHY